MKSVMRTFIVPILTLASCAVPALAAQPATYSRAVSIGWTVKQPTRYVVTGVLKKDGVDAVVRAAHSIEVADTEREAKAKFSASVARQYPGYTLIEVIAQQIPNVGICMSDI